MLKTFMSMWACELRGEYFDGERYYNIVEAIETGVYGIGRLDG